MFLWVHVDVEVYMAWNKNHISATELQETNLGMA